MVKIGLIANINDDGSFFSPYLDAASDISLFVDLAWQGLHFSSEATKYIDLKERIQKLNKESLEDKHSCKYKDNLEHAIKLEMFAKNQKNKGFSYLYGLASIRLWSILEAVVDDLVVSIIRNVPSVVGNEQIAKLRGPLVEFSQLDQIEQTIYLLELLKRDLNTNLKKGIGRFESLLGAVNLNGSVPDCIRKTLYELSQVRNVLVHRNGKVDKKFLENCPWINTPVGNDLKLTQKQFLAYSMACHWYIINMATRIMITYGSGTEDKEILDKHVDVLQHIENRLHNENLLVNE